MRIQEQMVKLLNEDSWDDGVRNYLDSSYTSMLKYLYIAIKNVCSFIHSFLFICVLFLIYNLYIAFVYFIKDEEECKWSIR